MIKTYHLTIPARNTSFVLRGKTNNSMRYNFSGEFKKGIVILVRTDEGGESPVLEPEKTIIDEIKSPEQLIEFVADKLEKVYQRPDAALSYAKGKGYEFPNLDMNKS